MRLLRSALLGAIGLLAATTTWAQALELGAQGIGPLRASTPFDHKAIQALFPTLTVRKGVASSEGEERPTVEVYSGKNKLMVVDGEGRKISLVTILNNAVKNTAGVSIGEPYSAAYGKQKAICQAGMEEDSGTVFCQSRVPNIHYQFVGQWNGSDGVVPPPGILSQWKVEKIIWQAAR